MNQQKGSAMNDWFWYAIGAAILYGMHQIFKGRGREDLRLDDIDERAFDRRYLDREAIPAYLAAFVAVEATAVTPILFLQVSTHDDQATATDLACE